MRNAHQMRRMTLAISMTAATLLSAQTPAPVPAPDAALTEAQRWIGRALIERGFLTASSQESDATGHVKGSPTTTDWTLAGVDLDKISRREPGQFVVEGYRVAISYNVIAHTFDRHPRKDERIKIVLPAPADEKAADAELAALFAQGLDLPLQRTMPPFWQHYFNPAAEWPADELKGVTIIGLDGKGPVDLIMPFAEKKVEPDFTNEARQARIKGSVTISLVVDADGSIHHIALRQPIGYGLDAEVAKAVARWRFKPGVLAGKPVAVQVIVNQGFDLTAAPQ